MSFLIVSILVLNHTVPFLFFSLLSKTNFHSATKRLKQDYLSEFSTRNRKLMHRLADTAVPANATGQLFKAFGHLEGNNCRPDTVT